MLETVRIRNYRSLKDVTLRLGELTVLIGPNDSGKSTVLDALYRLGRTPDQPLLSHVAGGGVFRSVDELRASYWMRSVDQALIWKASGTVPSYAFVYDLSVAPERQIQGAAPLARESLQVNDKGVDLERHSSAERTSTALNAPAQASRQLTGSIASALRTTHPFSFVPASMRVPSPLQEGTGLEPDGRNLAGAMDALLTGGNRAAVNAVEDALRLNLPSLDAYALRSTTLRDLDGPASWSAFTPGSSSIPQVQGRSGKALEFVMKRDDGTRVQIPATQVSDGALFLTAFLLLAYGDTPDVILIEEPENGLHPSRLGDVVKILRDMASGVIGDRPRQIVLTTHSPLLLNLAQPDEVRIVRRNDEGDTTITDLKDVPQLPDMLEEFGMGELWYLLGEKKLAEGAKP